MKENSWDEERRVGEERWEKICDVVPVIHEVIQRKTEPDKSCVIRRRLIQAMVFSTMV